VEFYLELIMTIDATGSNLRLVQKISVVNLTRAAGQGRAAPSPIYIVIFTYKISIYFLASIRCVGPLAHFG